ncbi:MAG: DUF87 domain-containing protein [Oscillospiraceae bacterium]|nr:DUF87 domain-containing protein [Oscillospiraceae bacterium]
MNGSFRDNQNYAPHESLRWRYFLYFVGRGLRRAFQKLYIIPISLLNLLVITLISLIRGSDAMAEMMAASWRFLLTVVSVILNACLLFSLGAPKGFIGITRRIERVPNFRNGDLEAPLLRDRAIIDAETRVEKWTLKCCGIAFDEWTDPIKQQQLENALDIAILGVDYGTDNTLVVLTLINHPGPWPEVIPWNARFLPKKYSELCVGVNRSYPIKIDLAVHPHYMIGGETGSGKTVLIKSLISQALHKGYLVYLIDMKHFVDYTALLPHLSKAVDSEDELPAFLLELVNEMHRRLKCFKECGCANIKKYNDSHAEKPMPRILCVIDEYMEAVVKTGDKDQKTRGEKNEAMIASLCKLARAAGISMILGLQRGGQEISGQIRSNTRILLGSCNDNLSIVMTGSTELGRMIPPGSVGMFVTENRQLFKSFYGGFPY